MARRSAAVLILVALVLWAALLYAENRGVPLGLTLAILPAFLIEVTLYFLTASQRFRARLPKGRLPLWMTLAAVPSYLVYTIPTGTFESVQAFAILGLGAVASFWFTFAGRRVASDVGFLLLMAAPVLFRIFDDLYPSPAPRIPMQTIGVIMWYRTGILAMLVIREFPGIGFGLIPRRVDWGIGLRNFLLFLAPGLALAYGLEFLRPELPAVTGKLLLNAIGYFVLTLWFLAVAEEFFFRGLLQQTLVSVFDSRLAGLLVASVLFGLVHLGFREFPNWRFALLATLAGIFYGRAYMQAASIRAAMVTHALVVTLWRIFLSG